MRNFYLSCKFCTLTINLSEVVLPGHIPLQIIVFGKERLRNVLNASQRRVNKNSLTWWYVLKTFSKRLQDVLKMSWRRFLIRLEDVFKTSWRRLCETSWKRLEDVRPRRIYWSWPRRFEDVRLRQTCSSWSRRLLKTKDVFKRSSSRRMFAGWIPEWRKQAWQKKLQFLKIVIFSFKFSDENNIAKLVVDMWGNCSNRLCQPTFPKLILFKFFYFVYILENL